MQDSRRDLVENELIFTDMHGVAGVGSTLVASDDVDALGEHVHDLPLPFISPLAPDDDGAGTLSWHLSLARQRRRSAGVQAQKNRPPRAGESP